MYKLWVSQKMNQHNISTQVSESKKRENPWEINETGSCVALIFTVKLFLFCSTGPPSTAQVLITIVILVSGTFQWELAGRSWISSPSWAGSSPSSPTSGPETQEDSGFWILGKSKSQRLNEIWKHNSSSLDLLHSFRASERRAWASRIVYMPLAHVCTGSPGTTTSNQTLEHSRWEADLSRLVCVFIHLKCFSPSVPHRLNVVGGSVNTLICFLLNCI